MIPTVLRDDYLHADLERTNALLSSSEADDIGVILRLPSESAVRTA